MSIYTDNGFIDRTDYINNLKAEYGEDAVELMISVLPLSEDFDGLVIALEDMACEDFL